MSTIPKRESQERRPGLKSAIQAMPDYMPRYPGSGRLARKHMIITGADDGIGRATAVAAAREGASVHLVYLNQAGDAEDTCAMIGSEGGKVQTSVGDITNIAFCKSVVENSMDRFGRIDVLFNNAADCQVCDEFNGISDQTMERSIQNYCLGCFRMTHACLPYLRHGRAAIINCTAITGYRGSSHLIDHAATKGAFTAFTRSLATALAGRGIRVNGVAPGPIWTQLFPASFDAHEVAGLGASVPLRRPGQPNEVAPSVIFLACNDASYMTGQLLHPNGGIAITT